MSRTRPPLTSGRTCALVEPASNAAPGEQAISGRSRLNRLAACGERRPKRVLAPDPDAPKLQKVLGQAGVGSRRDMEELILDGRITVNGEPAHIGQRISFGDRIEVNGRRDQVPHRAAAGARALPITSRSARSSPATTRSSGRPCFAACRALQHGKWQSVGRLDINTEGLLLFTNSGELANQLMHPRFGVEREYAVRVLGTLEPRRDERLLQGVMVEGQHGRASRRSKTAAARAPTTGTASSSPRAATARCASCSTPSA